jgi:4-hydroxybenzoate polyprenyltransferase
MSERSGGPYLKRTAIFLVESTVFVALAPLAMTSATIALTKNQFSWQLILLPFFACMLIYSSNRITDREEDAINMPDRTRFPHRLRIILLIVSLIFYVVLLAIIAQKNLLTSAIGILPLIVAFTYSVLRLKRVFILKNILSLLHAVQVS